MTLMSGKKCNENKWKNGYNNGYLDKPKTILTLRVSALLVIAVLLIVLLKFLVVLTGKPITLLLNDTGIDILAKVQFTSNWISDNCSYILWPSIKGLSWTIASCTLLYLDSDVPGVNPPITLSPRKARYSNQNHGTFHHIGYLTSLATGLVIFSFSLNNEL